MEQMLKILDNALGAGGAWLSRKQMGLGNNRKDTELLNTLGKKGYLSSLAKNKFSVDEKGLAFWKQKTDKYRYQTVHDDAIEKFLRVVRQRGGKKFTKTQIRVFPMFWIERALQEKYCDLLGEDKFHLLPSGEDFLFSRLPAIEQAKITHTKFFEKLDKIKKQQRELQHNLTGLQNEVVKGFSELQQQEAQAQQLGVFLRKKIEDFDQAYLQSVQELQTCHLFVEATRMFRQQVIEEREKTIADIKMRCGEMGRRLGEIEIKTVGKLQQIEGKFGDFHKQLCDMRKESDAKIAPQKLRSIPLPTLHDDFASKIKLEEYPEEEIFEIVCEIYRRHSLANPHLAGSMPIPELFDELKKIRAVVELKVLHELLLEWMLEERIALWICSTPGLEPRAGEGIKSERGLLFYLRIKKGTL